MRDDNAPTRDATERHGEIRESTQRAGGGLLGEILPRGVAWTEAFDHDAEVALAPAEAAAIANAVPKRRREFTAARAAARSALAQLGVTPAPIVPGPRGRPTWPHGVVGTITHCDGYCAAAVGRAREFAAIGIDAEPHAPLPDGVLSLVAAPSERAHLSQLAEAEPGVCWDRLLFCAKEAVYKVWSPLTGRWLGFEEATLTITDGAFTASLAPAQSAAGDPVGFSGRWLVRGGLILAAITVDHVSRDMIDGSQ